MSTGAEQFRSSLRLPTNFDQDFEKCAEANTAKI